MPIVCFIRDPSFPKIEFVWLVDIDQDGVVVQFNRLAPFTYSAVLGQMASLPYLVWYRPRSNNLLVFLRRIFVVGSAVAAFAFIMMLPMAVFGMFQIFLPIALLGFVPLVTAMVYYRAAKHC